MLNIRPKITFLMVVTSFPAMLLRAAEVQIKREERPLDSVHVIKVSRSDGALNKLGTQTNLEVRQLHIAAPTASEDLALYISNQRALNLTASSESKAFMQEDSSLESLKHAAVIGKLLAGHIDDNKRDMMSLQERVALIDKPKLTCRQILLAICCCK